MNNVFRDFSQTIKIYLATETVVDPYEKNTSLSELNSIPIKAIVTDLISSQSQWKMPGIVTEKAKALIINKRHKSLIEKSQKIEIDGEYFEGWKVNGRMQIRDDGDYVRVYIYIKKV